MSVTALLLIGAHFRAVWQCTSSRVHEMLADVNCNSYCIYIYIYILIARQYTGIHGTEPVLLNVPLAIYTAEAVSGSGQ